MNKQQFISNMLDSAREVVARAVDNLLKDYVFCQDVRNISPFVDAMFSVAECQRLTLNKWCCMFTCLHLLSWLKHNYEQKYNVLLFNDADFALMDSFVSFYQPLNQTFK